MTLPFKTVSDPSATQNFEALDKRITVGAGVPTYLAAEGAMYSRNDSPYGFYQRQAGAWVKIA